MEELKEQLKDMIVKELKMQGISASDIGDDEPLFEDGLGLDSLDAVELVVLIQKHFGVQIEDMDEGKVAFASINALSQYIKERKQD